MKRKAFTLVELLVSMVVIGIIGGMVAMALDGASRAAKETRAQGLANSLNLVALQIYEENARRRINLPAGFVTIESRALSALCWKRDWLRCSFPERREDLISLPVAVPYPTVDTSTTPSTSVLQFIDDNRAVPSITAGINAGGTRSQEILKYRILVARSIQASTNIIVSSFAQLLDGDTTNGEWTSEHQAAECLYLILSTNVVNGVPASDMLNQRDVADVDEDGMPEIIDPWGNPVGFMRWPVGLALTPEWNDPIPSPESTTARAQWAQLAAIKNELGRDSLDLLYADPRFLDNETVDPNDFPQAEDPFPLNPVIVLAGADGRFDLYGLDVNTALVPAGPPPISYAPGGLPDASPSFIEPFPDKPGRPNFQFPTGMPFIDPYMDGVPIATKLGARMDTNGDGINDSSDNVLPLGQF
ncbi:MAG: type II secretion system protein [Planctomycetota bacterium]